MGHLLCGAFIAFFSHLIFISKPTLQMRNLRFKENQSWVARVQAQDALTMIPHCLARLILATIV